MSDRDEGGARAPGYATLQRQLVASLGADARVRAILLTGSAARGNADAYSDLDLGLIVETDATAAVLEVCMQVIGPLAHSTRIDRGPVIILSALLAEGLRVDLLLEPAGVAVRRRQPPHRVLLDRDGLADRLDLGQEPPPADPAPLVAEFLRVLALLRVVIGREEYFVGAQGVMLLREYLIDLFYIENGRSRNRGRKRLNDELTAEQQSVLGAQPGLVQDRASVIEGHRAAAQVFLARARALLDAHNLPWPESLAAVVQQQLTGLIDASVLASR